MAKKDNTKSNNLKDEKKKIKKDKKKDSNDSVKGLKAVRLEISKVRWPSKNEMIKYSIATVIFVIFFGVFFYLIELLMAFLKSIV